MWSQEFDGPAGAPPDPDAWVHETGGGGWGDHQLQIYTADPANAALDGAGHLVLTARGEADGSITSARLVTRGRFAVRYGRVAVRMRVPGTAGSWPAFWMLGDDIDEVGWPACGEIDVVEHVGADPSRCHGTLHGPGYAGLEGGIGGAVDAGSDLAADFHEYAVDWTPEAIGWSLDGEEYHRLTPADVPEPWPFDRPFHLLLNLAIGGDWPGNAAGAPDLPAALVVDWVRVTTNDCSPGGRPGDGPDARTVGGTR